MGDLINGRTPEEIKRVLAWRVFRCGNIDCGDCSYGDICSHENEERSEPDALALIEHLEAKQPKWNSVEEQPNPPEDGEYWCCGYWLHSGRKQAETAEYLGGEWKIVNNFILTHWMPLPEPPEGGNHG